MQNDITPQILFENLEQVELLSLALDASRNNNTGEAMTYLKEAVSREDATAVAHYLLGAEYAQIQMYDRAISHMEAAIAIDPALEIARFQLGLLWLTSGHGENAESVLSPLQLAPEHNALHHFGKGLIHLIHDQFPECIQSLNHGIELNTENVALNNDMNRILEEIKKMETNTPSANPQQEEADNPDAKHVFLSAYTGSGER